MDQSALNNLTITPYMKSRIGELAPHGAGKHGRTAVVFGKNFFAQVAVNILNMPAMRTGIGTKLFTDREQAIAWLAEILEPASN